MEDPTLRTEGTGWRGKGPSKIAYDHSGADNNLNSGYKMTFGRGITGNNERCRNSDERRDPEEGSEPGYQYQNTPLDRLNETPSFDRYQGSYDPEQHSSSGQHNSCRYSRKPGLVI